MSASAHASSTQRPLVARALRIVRVLGWAHLVVAIGTLATLALLGESTRATLVLLYAPRAPLLISTLAVVGVAALARDARLLQAHVALAMIVLFPWMGLRLEGASRPRGEPIRLLTYNVFYGKLGREAVASEIAAADADVAVLQAADHVFEPLRARLRDRVVRRDGEFALATKLPLVAARVPPSVCDGSVHTNAEYVIDVHGRPLRLVVVHPFSPRDALFGDADAATDVAERERQIAEAAEAAQRSREPVVIVGDTNLPPLSRIARRHLGGFRDAFESVGFGFGYTFPAKRPWMRIDRALAGPGVRFLSAEVGKRGASDHRSLLVTLEVTSDVR